MDIAPILAAYDAATPANSIGFDNAAEAQVLTGGAAAAQVLSPEGYNQQGVARWVDRSGGISLGYPAFTMSMRSPTRGSRIHRINAKFVLPTLEQTSASTSSGIQPAPTKAYDLTCVQDWLIPDRASDDERLALMSFVVSCLVRTIRDSASANPVTTSSPLIDAVLTLDRPY